MTDEIYIAIELFFGWWSNIVWNECMAGHLSWLTVEDNVILAAAAMKQLPGGRRAATEQATRAACIVFHEVDSPIKENSDIVRYL